MTNLRLVHALCRGRKRMNNTFRTMGLMAVFTTLAFAQAALRPAQREPASVESAATPKIKGQTKQAVSARRYAGTKQEAARAYLADSAHAGIPLRLVASKRLGSRTYVRFQQQLEGIPVTGAHVVVEVSADNEAHAVQSRVEPRLKSKGEWILKETDAIARATDGMVPNGQPRVERIFVVRDGSAVPAYNVLFRCGNPAGDWSVVVSAQDGAILSKDDLRSGAHVLGQAYPKNPMRSDVERVPLENLTSTTALTSAQTQVFTYLPALRGQVAPGTVVQGASRKDGHFLYAPDDARFSEVQLYYGMETASVRFQRLGFWGFDAPMKGTVLYQDYDEEKKRFVGANNAFFTPFAFGDDPGMFFYLTGGNGDVSLDIDVIFHEYAHAVVSELVGPYQSETFKALNEGTADYFSSSFLDDPILGEYAAKIFKARSSFVRRTDNGNRWPYNIVGEVHADGNIWSGALWDVREQLGADITDEIAINAIAMLSPNAEFYDAAEAAINAADELYGSRAAEIVATAMERRGIFIPAAQTAAGAKRLEPGRSAAGSIRAANPGRLMVAAQQYRVDVPNQASKLLISVNADANVRFYIRYRVPITIEDGFIMAEQVSDTARATSGFLSIRNRPELQAGSYYVVVVNTEAKSANYTVSAEVEGGEPGPTPSVTLLQNGATEDGSVPSGPFLSSRQFAVQVPEGTRAVSVVLQGDQDVDLYLRIGKPVRVTGTGYPEGDLVSDSESSREDLRITASNGGPIPAGLYFFGVYNYSGETARYTISARVE
jgi:Zn-dependent metalloprotease